MAMSVYLSNRHGLYAMVTLFLIWTVFSLSKGARLAQVRDHLTSSIGVPAKTKPSSNTATRPLILYAYTESENARENIKFFLQQGLHGAADFVFILNGETNVGDLIPVEELNVRIIHRPNLCFDLGAYGEVLRRDDLWKGYRRFITMNASIRGPFLPYWSTRCWTDAYLERVTADVKLVGLSANCYPRPHVQSMIWATDDVGMALLLDPPANASVADKWGGADDPVAFSACYRDFDKAIHAEIGATSAITGVGYEAVAMMSAFRGPEYFAECHQHPLDVLYDGQYFGTNIHPYETLFVKANRDIDPATLKLLTDIHLADYEGRSWDLCK